MSQPSSVPERPFAFVLFVLSGICGLLYQVVWLRLAFATFGVITPILSVVISVFMLGLSLGSWAAGRWVWTWASAFRASPLVLYGVAELIIGIGALQVSRLFGAGQRILLPLGAMDSTPYLAISAVILAVTILPWCVFMGTTFPLMIAFLRQRDPAASTSFSHLYLANVIGAMLGTLLTAGVLIEVMGLHATIRVGAAINGAIALIALLWAVRLRGAPARAPRVEVRDEPRPSTPGAVPGAPWSRGLTYAVLLLTGLTSMGMEVAWTRSFTPVLRTTIYSYASILTTYLLATWLGSYRYRRDLERGRVQSPERLVASLAALSLLPLLLDPRLALPLPVAIPATWASIFPFCFGLGYLTPLIIDRFAAGDPARVGRAYAVNVLGCILGPLLAGYWILPAVGSRVGLVLLALPFAAFFVSFSVTRRLPPRWTVAWGGSTAALLLAAVTVLASYEDRTWYQHGRVLRDHTATVLCRGTTRWDQRLYVNGFSVTTLCSKTKVMAHLPLALLGRRPQSAAVICFGMGTTFRSLSSWDIRTTAIELVPSVRSSFDYFHPDADSILRLPGRSIVVDDGRRYLARTDQRFDVITIDPPPPVAAAGSSLLYSRDFYEIIKRRLAPGGILQQWFPGGEQRTLEASLVTVLDAFPHVRVFHAIDNSGFHFICSMVPVVVPSVDQTIARMPPAARADLVEWEPGTSIERYVGEIMARETAPASLIVHHPQPMIDDDRPYNEYCLLRQGWAILRGRNVRVI